MDLDFAARTDVGRIREHNEDNFLVDRNLRLYIVCDGMGGHQGGEVASATAVNIVRETLADARSVIESYRNHDGTGSESEVLSLLERAVQRANSRIYERGQTNAKQKGMGTTLSMVILMGSNAFTAHVGDSRIYRKRSGKIEQLTQDHSFIEEMKVRQPEAVPGMLAERLKNAITRAVGGGPLIDVDVACHRLQEGDLFLLCTDGLSGYFDDSGPKPLMTEGKLEQVADGMIEFANDQGGEDNVTALLVRVKTLDDAAPVGLSPFAQVSQLKCVSHLTQNQLTALVRAGELVELKKGDKLEMASDSDGVWLVVSGCFAAADPRAKSVKRTEGSFLGLVSFLWDSPGGGVARSLEDSSALFVPGEVFRGWAMTDPDLALKLSYVMLRDLSSRLGGQKTRRKARGNRGFSPWSDKEPRAGRITETMPALPHLRAQLLDSAILEEAVGSPPDGNASAVPPLPPETTGE